MELGRDAYSRLTRPCGRVRLARFSREEHAFGASCLATSDLEKKRLLCSLVPRNKNSITAASSPSRVTYTLFDGLTSGAHCEEKYKQRAKHERITNKGFIIPLQNCFAIFCIRSVLNRSNQALIFYVFSWPNMVKSPNGEILWNRDKGCYFKTN